MYGFANLTRNPGSAERRAFEGAQEAPWITQFNTARSGTGSVTDIIRQHAQRIQR